MKGFRSFVVLTFVFVAMAVHAGDGTVHHRAEKVPNSYIVILYPNQPVDTIGTDIEKHHGGRLTGVAKALGMFSISLPNEASARAIARDPRVAAVQEDGILHLQQCGRLLDLSGSQWALAHLQNVNVPADFSDAPGPSLYQVRVYIIDGSIEPQMANPSTDLNNQPYNNSKVTEVHNFVTTSDNGGDNGKIHVVSPIYSHGTAVASVLAGNTYGVVPEITSIVSVVVADGLGSASDSALMLAGNFVATDHLPGQPAVANVSLAATDGDIALDGMLTQIVNDGVFVATAAGNDSTVGHAKDACTASPGRIGGTARYPGLMVTGATNYDGYTADYSDVGACVDIWAPGGDMYKPVTTSAGSGTGTSLAAPAVAGAAVLILSRYPTWAPADVWSQLKYGNATFYRGLRTLQIPYPSECFAHCMSLECHPATY